MLRKSKFVDLGALLCLWVVLVVSFLLLSPRYETVPHRDSGIFLYVGSELLQGKLLYQQIWENKQPLIYLLNAAGLGLSGGAVWGVWVIELVLFGAAFSLGYFLLRRRLHPAAAWLLCAGSFLTIFQVMSGNFTEEYAVAFDLFLLSWFFLVYLRQLGFCRRILAALGMGVLAAFPFCLKQTYLNTSAAIALFMLFLAWFERDRRRLVDFGSYAAGFLLVNAGFFIYFLSRGALRDYWVDAFLINQAYSQQGLLEWLHALQMALAFNSDYPLLFLAVALWGSLAIFIAAVLIHWLRDHQYLAAVRWVLLCLGLACLGMFGYAQLRGAQAGIGLLQGICLGLGIFFTLGAAVLFWRHLRPTPLSSAPSLRQNLAGIEWTRVSPQSFFFLGFIDLPVTALFISLSGQNFPHYYISLLPSLFLLLSGAALFIEQKLRVQEAHRFWNYLFVSLMLVGIFAPVSSIFTRLRSSAGGDDRSAAAAYLKSVTQPGEKVLVWGWEAGIYYLAEREAPTRYAFQFPLYLDSPFQAQAQQTLLSDIESDPPSYILDTVDSEMPLLAGESLAACRVGNSAATDGLAAIRGYICSHYVYVKGIGSYNLYQRAD